ncbi:ribosome small subunit-dependent GTPase A [Thermodesulfobacteriota bacterium]
MNLEDLGWNSYFEKELENHVNRDNLLPARVSQEHKGLYTAINHTGEYLAEISGKMRYTSSGYSDFPAVGDWVLAKIYTEEKKAIIHGLLKRKNRFSRKAVLSGGMPDSQGKTEEQVLAANVDTVFLVNGLDSDFSLRRIERYMTTVYDSSMHPVIVLNKTDLVENPEDYVEQVKSIAFGVPVIPVCGLKSEGMDMLREHIRTGDTIVLLGSSGVGKSTIINRLFGMNRQKVNEVREYDQKGRHTTTSRELMVLPDGGILIDTPGMREFQPWKGEEDTARTFEDIESYAENCRFRDCNHESEPGCAVRRAIDRGHLDSGRYENYVRMKKEARYLETRVERSAQLAEKNKWKAISKIQKQLKKDR